MDPSKEVHIETVGDLKKLLDTLPDDVEIDFIDFAGGDTVLISIQEPTYLKGHKTVILSKT